MAVFALWAGRIPGLVTVDIADFGRRYIVSDRPSAWYFGMISHLVNSVILVFAWASLIEPNIHRPERQILRGLVWGQTLALTLAGTLVSPMSGLGFMGRRTGSARYAMTNILMHAVWGLVIGSIYTPRRTRL